MHASEAMEFAIQLLRKAGCDDVKPNMVRFVGRKQLEEADASMSDLRCWYDAQNRTYFVNDSVLFVETDEQSCVGVDSKFKDNIVESVQQSVIEDERAGSCAKLDAANDKVEPSAEKGNDINSFVGHSASLQQPEEKRVEVVTHANAEITKVSEEKEKVDDVPADYSEEKTERVGSDENSESMIVKREVVVGHAIGEKDSTDEIANVLHDKETPIDNTTTECEIGQEGGAPLSKDDNMKINEELTNEVENENKDVELIDKNGEYEDENEDKIDNTDSIKENSISESTCRIVCMDQNEGKDDLSVSSEQTDKIMNSCKECVNGASTAKRRYRHTREAAFLLGLNIAREHPDASLLERFVACHSS